MKHLHLFEDHEEINEEFDLKKFISLLGIDDQLMGEFYDRADAAGLEEPTFDLYHIRAGEEVPKPEELEVMKKMYDEVIKGKPLEKEYEVADRDFDKNLAAKNARRRAGR